MITQSQSYVKSVEYGQTHSDGAELDLRSGAAAPLTIHVATAAGSVSGTVRDDQGPAAGVSVVLVDVGLRPTPSIVQSGTDGSYNFAHVAPGKYRLVASDDGYAIGHEEDLEAVGGIVETAYP